MVHTGNVTDTATLTSSANDVDHFLINDGGVLKRIAKGNVKLSQFSNDANFATSASTGFSTSTLGAFPTDVGDSTTVDFSDAEGGGVVSIVSLFDCMEPNGQINTTNLGADEDHVGA